MQKLMVISVIVVANKPDVNRDKEHKYKSLNETD